MTGEDAEREAEISLVDLFAVLLRHRRLIVVLPLAVTLAAGIYLYAFGGKLGPAETYRVQLSVPIAPMPADLLGRVEVDPVQVVNAYFSDLPTHKAAYAEFYPKEAEKGDESRLNTYLRDRFIGKRFTYSHDQALRRYTISLTDTDRDRAARYLESLGAGAAAILNERLAKGYALSLAILDAQIDGLGRGDELPGEARAIVASLVYQKERIAALRANPRFPIEAEPELLVYHGDGLGVGRAKTLVLALFASGFLAFMLAFALEAARKIRKDPAAREKIAEALRA